MRTPTCGPLDLAAWLTSDSMANTTSTASEDISELIAVDEQSQDVFVSRSFPQRTGNTLRIGYGGCTTAVMIQAVCKTVQPQYQLFSFLGSFLGPTSIDHKIHCRVARTRDTRSLASRVVYAFQILENGSERVCAQASADFHVPEPALYTYSIPLPTIDGDGPEDEHHAPSARTLLSRGIEDGHITSSSANSYFTNFHLMDQYFDWRHCLTSTSTQTLLSLAPHLPTTHDSKPLTARPQIEYIRLKCRLPTPSANWAALAFYMDGGLSFLPLHLDHKSLEDAGACSTLDFALRVVETRGMDFGAWHLRERRTMAAAGGRTLSEGWVWDGEGRVVATMSQTGILRPRGEGKGRGKL
ncbi:hypothetical protein M409DRAFT_16676 [Zasmidium cellare ATCC 36951]|uniref:Acyl-CoA thioesterase II n=1 Tax=Zasmidium cellare ATCC 36951 TaxID=1080233 RepID=A0A6A6CZY5_ZASCE|nr:uncharacterized protein M409DRAFT_16676 [Zasmidium cellare ATCC 36951]KAF2172714.1 hypothetical protein M409DRAFT_16676 [Zasmidium cellare ATCC 36951]